PCHSALLTLSLHDALPILCEILGADAYVSINVGSATVYDMIEWIEYMTSDSDVEMANWRRRNGREEPWDIKFVGIGNESWGCGGDRKSTRLNSSHVKISYA